MPGCCVVVLKGVVTEADMRTGRDMKADWGKASMTFLDAASRAQSLVWPDSDDADHERLTLEVFLAEVEARAYRYALVAVRDPDDALDVVQDAMLALVRHYADRPPEEWRPLFFRILGNRVRDFSRRRTVRAKLMRVFSPASSRWPGESADPIADAAASDDSDPRHRLEQEDAIRALDEALRELPERQREAFVLRVFEGMDVAQTAVAMGCSEGSVKTHHFRAIARLRGILGEHR